MEIPEKVIRKFMLRSGCKRPSKARKTLERMLLKAKPIEMNPIRKVLGIINNFFEEAEYLGYNTWIFVIVNNKVKTVYKNERGWFLNEGK